MEQEARRGSRWAEVMQRRTPGDRIDPEFLGVAVLIMLAVVCCVLIGAVVAKTSDEAATAAQEALTHKPPPLAGSSVSRASASEDSTSTRLVALISDSIDERSRSDVSASLQWPALLQRAAGVEVRRYSATGAGYTVAGSGGDTFVTAASEVSTKAKIVIFVGGAADASVDPVLLATAATNAYSAVSQRASGSQVVVVGPLVADGATRSELKAVRSVLRQSARIAGARYLDPSGVVDSGARTSDELTVQDQRDVADRLAIVLHAAAG